MTIVLERMHPFGYRVSTALGTRDLLVQTDWDYPGLASTFGWDMRDVQVMQARYYGVPCAHSGTDGTIACADCGLLPSTFIEYAAEYLDAHDGITADDPGYFERGR